MNKLARPPLKRESVPEELHDDMSAGGLIHALQHIDFVRGRALLELDRGVRVTISSRL